MKAFQLREDAKSTWLYCVLCFSVIGVDYPGYRDNVFMFFKNHCRTSCDLSQSPAAAIYLNDLQTSVRLKFQLMYRSSTVFAFNKNKAVFAKSMASPIHLRSQLPCPRVRVYGILSKPWVQLRYSTYSKVSR